jgi:hypothetical protein
MNDIVEAAAPALQDLLDEHAEVLAEHAEAIRKYAKRTVDDLLEIGRRLAEVKKLLGYGNWLPWLEREFCWSEDTAERLIAIYELQQQIPHVRNLDLPFSGLYLLGRHTTPPKAVEAVVTKAEAGGRVTVAEIKETILQSKATALARKSKVPSYVRAEKHGQAEKSAKAVTPRDDALFAFTERVLELKRRISNYRPLRFAKTAVGADDLARLGKFFTDLAQLKKEDWGAS